MDFGMFANVGRPTRTARAAWEEDLFEIETADRLGIAEAWISEHMYPAEFTIARLAHSTSRIRMGPGVRPVPAYHPLTLVQEANALDQLTNGRYMFGAGTGFMGGRFNVMKQRALNNEDAHPMLWEAIDYMEQVWAATEPFDFHGTYYQGRGLIQGTAPRLPPIQTPHPPVAVACHESPSTAEEAGKRGVWMLLGHAADYAQVRELGDIYTAAAQSAGRVPSRREMRVARYVYVTEDNQRAKDELRETMTPAIAHEAKTTPHHFWRNLPPSGRAEDVDFDWVIDSGQYIAGDPDTVYQHIKNFYDASGGFGHLMLFMGRDYGTREGRARSMELFMEQVAPRLRALDPDRDFPFQAAATPQLAAVG